MRRLICLIPRRYRFLPPARRGLLLLLGTLATGRVEGANLPGFVVNGVLPPQTGSVIGQNNCCSGDTVTATGVFTGAFSKNTNNIYYTDTVAISNNAVITSPGNQPL